MNGTFGVISKNGNKKGARKTEGWLGGATGVG